MAKFNNKALLDELIKNAENTIAAAFGNMVIAVQANTSLRALAALIESGQFNQALSILEQAGAGLASVANSVYMDAGYAQAASMTDKLGIIVNFDVTNARAVRHMAENSLDLIRGFAEGQRAATREALIDGITRGANPRAQARAFRDSIGLTEHQVKIVNNYRDELENLNRGALRRELRDGRFDKTIENAIKNDTPLSSAQIDKMTGRYRERWIKYRSEVIARTESLRSVHAGAKEQIDQAVESGAVEATDAKSTWNTARDERVRDFSTGASTSHQTMHNQTIAFGQKFVSGAGNELLYPGDPAAPGVDTIQCRCRVSTSIAV